MTELAVPDLPDIADALARMSPRTVLSHRTAAQLWGLWIPRFGAIEVTTPAGAQGSAYTTGVQRRRIVSHRRITSPEDVATKDGLPLMSIARTWVDLAPLLNVHDLVAAGDSALRTGAPMAELERQVAKLYRVRGARRARVALGLLDGRSRSRPESRIRVALVLAGLPKPRVNEPIFDEHGQWVAEPDLSYEEARLALEFNGAGHADWERMKKDSIRNLDVIRARWKTLTYTAPHAFGRLHEVVDDVYTELRRRAPHLLTQRAASRRAS